MARSGRGDPIKAQITITAHYEDEITITVHDVSSSTDFVTLTLNREQFINAAMNRLGNTDVESAVVYKLDRVGKEMEMQKFEFVVGPAEEIGFGSQAMDSATLKALAAATPKGWIPDKHFSSQDSYFKKDGVLWARTTLRRWV